MVHFSSEFRRFLFIVYESLSVAERCTSGKDRASRCLFFYFSRIDATTQRSSCTDRTILTSNCALSFNYCAFIFWPRRFSFYDGIFYDRRFDYGAWYAESRYAWWYNAGKVNSSITKNWKYWVSKSILDCWISLKIHYRAEYRAYQLLSIFGG